MAHHRLIPLLFTLSAMATSLAACADDDDGEPLGHCKEICARSDECGLLEEGGGDVESCVNDCSDALGDAYATSAACGVAGLEVQVCGLQLTCEEAGSIDEAHCEEEIYEFLEVCV
jgi:hypothetical protein